jgi:H+/gluconate symporter-like permease
MACGFTTAAPSSANLILTAKASDSAGGSTSWLPVTFTAGHTYVIPASDIELRYQATSTILSIGPTTSSTTSPTTSPLTTPTVKSDSKQLSTGDKVAIGLVVPLVIILLGIAVGIFLVLRKKKLAAKLDEAGQEPSEAKEDANEAEIMPIRDSRLELRQELHG